MNTVRFLVTLSVAISILPDVASAHAFGQRYDLPLPLAFYLVGAGFAVALSFIGSFIFMHPSDGRKFYLSIPVPIYFLNIFASLLRVLALAIFALIVATALFGPEAPVENFATVFIWVIWWVGMFLTTALVIDLWSIANPFSTLIDAALRILGRGHHERSLPSVVGWFAVVGLIFLSWIELISDWSESPRVMALLIAVYALTLFGGSLVVGRKTWFSAVDPVTRLFDLLGRIAPLSVGSNAIRLRVPAYGLVGLSLSVAQAVFVLTLIAIVLFDGLSETPVWAAILQWIQESQFLRPKLLSLRTYGIDLLALIRTVALFMTISICVVLYYFLAIFVWLASGRCQPLRLVFTAFACSLMPIAVAYHLAHYISYIALAGQLIIPISSDPFGLGWNLFGGAGRIIDLSVITARDVWWIASIALITGHALSVFVAHSLALKLFTDNRKAIISQFPMMVFMVGMTSLSLWILAQPIVS